MYFYLKDNGNDEPVMVAVTPHHIRLDTDHDAIIEYDGRNVSVIKVSGRRRMRDYVLALIDFSNLIERIVTRAEGWKL